MPGPRLIAVALTGLAALAVAPGAVGASDDEPVAQAAAAKATITMSGSTSVRPLAKLLAQGYVKANPGKARFKISGGSTDIGINDVANGKVTIGNASRDPRPGDDPGGLQFNRIARDGVCIVTNPANRLPDISQEQVQAIFSGRVSDWNEVPGATVSGPIELKVRTPVSGTADSFKQVFMGENLNVSSAADEYTANGLVQSQIASASQRNAIGYVDLRFTQGTNVVNYRGTACTLANAKSGTYRGLRNFWMVTKGAPKGATAAFLRWIRSSSKAKSIISSGWVAVR